MQHQIRDMTTADLSKIQRIEDKVHISPWSRLAFEQSLTAEHLCRVCCKSEQIIGFHISSHVLNELHILNLAVASNFQGQGYAHCLLQDILQLAEKKYCNKLFLEVRESNQKAQSLYRKWGFEQISVRENYYKTLQNTKEPAFIFMKKLDVN